MGRNSRTRPKRLAEKLKQIRESLDLSQDGMLVRLDLDKTEGLERSVISAFELDKREPSLDVLLAYARVANVYVEVLIDDKINLPDKLPAKVKSEDIKK
jgi:transcriptional regulator with XRE-family HTH domain